MVHQLQRVPANDSSFVESSSEDDH